MILTNIFYHVDNFCRDLTKILDTRIISSTKSDVYEFIDCKMPLQDVMTILIYFHRSGYRNFKRYYHDCADLYGAFNYRLSYTRFVEIIRHTIFPLFLFMKLYRCGSCTGTCFIDSTKLQVCHNLRITNNKVFSGMAKRGKTTTGWFYGFKLHLIINDIGEIVSFSITPGNTADSNKELVKQLAENCSGRLVGDRGYISKALFEDLFKQGLELIIKIKKNMKNKLMDTYSKFILNKRGIIEATNGILKSTCQIEHSRHRSPLNFLVNLLSGLVAYSFLEKKPSIRESMPILTVNI